ncbi:sugar kinase [Enemella dayhoffiae]|uniref:Sugar kinase n=1 Tax=Enemella dayhoffiae TaxID=2016507 RepID=A0A255GRX2_9ACTN|nr:FGGY family carbohydrate kinase [Enemella dayhoffiae]OYO18559.1 sugar kinase [Enemella dayhoffiae]
MTVLGVDLGTSVVKAAVFDPAGRVLGAGHAPLTTHWAGRVHEQDPADWWNALVQAVRATGAADDSVSAIGFTGQMQTLTCVGPDGAALRPAILYSDDRATAEADEVRSDVPEWDALTANEQDGTSITAKARWLGHHEPGVLERTEAALLGAPGHVIVRAGGAAVCDATTAATTGLMDFGRRRWEPTLVEAAGLPPHAMPRLEDAPAVAGVLAPDAARELGLRAGIPLVHALGDAGSTTHGFIGLDPGSAYLYLGTSAWVAAVGPTPEVPRVGAVHHLSLPGSACLRIGAVLSGGAAADWARRYLLGDVDFATADRRARERLDVVDPAHLPLCLPSLSGARTPVRDIAARGAFVGVDAGTQPEDLYLAVLLGVALDLRCAADLMGGPPSALPLVGGGSRSPAWRQLLADAFGADILTTSADLDMVGARSAAAWAAEATGDALALDPIFRQDDGVVRTRPRSPLSDARIAQHLRLYEALATTFHDLSNRIP